MLLKKVNKIVEMSSLSLLNNDMTQQNVRKFNFIIFEYNFNSFLAYSPTIFGIGRHTRTAESTVSLFFKFVNKFEKIIIKYSNKINFPIIFRFKI
jgi:hypothetical protein